MCFMCFMWFMCIMCFMCVRACTRIPTFFSSLRLAFSSFPWLGEGEARMLWVRKWVFLGFCDLGNILPLMTGLLLKETALGTTWLVHTSVAQNWAWCEDVCVCAKADVFELTYVHVYVCTCVFVAHLSTTWQFHTWFFLGSQFLAPCKVGEGWHRAQA